MQDSGKGLDGWVQLRPIRPRSPRKGGSFGPSRPIRP